MLQASELDLAYARQSIAAAVAKGWFLATEARLQRALAAQIVRATERSESLAKDRQRVGVGDVNLEKLAQEMKFKSAEEFLAALGRGDVGPQILARALRDQGAPAALQPVRRAPLPRRSTSGVLVEGLGDVPLSMARCCMPEPPDPIVAYTTVGRGVTVHRRACPNLAKFNPGRVLQAAWSESRAEGGFSVSIRLRAFDRQGLLRDVSDVFTKERVDVLRVNTESVGEYAHMAMTVRVREASQIARLLNKLGHVQGAIETGRR